MNEGFMTTLYKAQIEKEKFPSIKKLKESIFNFLCTDEYNLNSRGFVVHEELKEVTFYVNPIGIVTIDYKVNYLPKDKIILLSFYPKWSREGLDPKKWRRNDNFRVALKVLEFCDLLGDSIRVSIEEYGEINFSRIYFSDYIDISKWNVSIFGKRESTLENILNNREWVYNLLIDHSKRKDYTFILFSSIVYDKDLDKETRENGLDAIKALKEELQKFGEVDGPYNSLEFKYILETYPKGENVIVIFIETADIIGLLYKNFKKYLDVNNIPSQFISIETILEKFKFFGVKLNFLLELFSKIGEQKPLSLKQVPSLFSIDGVLCLSDIKDASTKKLQRLFGALFMYTEPKAYEEIHIYEDIPYKVKKGRIIFENETSIERLAKYVHQLGGEDKLVMDIFLTRPWKRKCLDKFIEQLMDFKYVINRVYYISTIRSRFLDETIINNLLKKYETNYKVHPKFRYNLSEYWHYYAVISDKIAFVRTSTQLRIYPNLFNLYIELLWPETGSISKEDIEKIIWFSKKRLYRFQEFFVTKFPEPVWIFRNIRKLYLGEVNERIKIPLRLMI